jgi:hypothetical protein
VKAGADAPAFWASWARPPSTHADGTILPADAPGDELAGMARCSARRRVAMFWAVAITGWEDIDGEILRCFALPASRRTRIPGGIRRQSRERK